MTSNGHHVSQYNHRLDLVAEAITAHTKMHKKAAVDLAVHVLQAVDHIPEKMR
jgi:Family of unknown function (DUF6307)